MQGIIDGGLQAVLKVDAQMVRKTVYILALAFFLQYNSFVYLAGSVPEKILSKRK